MINADIGWSDLGTWGSLYTHLETDNKGNTTSGQQIVLKDVSNSLIRIPKEKVAIVQGLDGYIIVDTPEALLITKKEDEQDIKALRLKVGDQFGDQYI